MATGVKWSLPIALYPLIGYLAAITIIGKGPTYIGIPPVFWGEAALAASLAWAISQRGPLGVCGANPKSLSAVVFLFMFVGAALTAVSFQSWGIEAIRDAAIWYYAALYFVGLTLASFADLADRVWRCVLLFWLLALIWAVADAASGDRLSEMGPVLPWRGVSVLSNSHSEVRQNMALGAIIVLCTSFLTRRPLVRVLLAGPAIAGLALLAASRGRGTRLGIAAGLVAVMFLAFARGAKVNMSRRVVAMLGLLVVAAMLATSLADIDLVRRANFDRFLDADLNAPVGTAYWRMIWWQNLIDEVLTKNALFGLGFGENLSVYNPFIIDELRAKWPVRSPHNFNMTVFSRMGIVGSVLWAAVLVLGIGGLFARLWRGGEHHWRYSDQRREELAFWLLVLIATWVNSSFGVLMEGPVLGVWFWFALGFATGRSLCPYSVADLHTSRLQRRIVPVRAGLYGWSSVGVSTLPPEDLPSTDVIVSRL
jgi:hypothetical protein